MPGASHDGLLPAGLETVVVTLCVVWQTEVWEHMRWLQRKREGHVNVHVQQVHALQPLLVTAVHTERRSFQRWWAVERLVRCQVSEQSLCCTSSDHSILAPCRAVPNLPEGLPPG